MKTVVVVACCAIAGSARAFSDPLSYSDPVDAGGGAGRWFTGSSADGYGCDVCHVGAAGADLTVSGLPIEGYVPGRAYEVSITWPPNVVDVSLIAEFTNETSQGAGELALPRPETLVPAELCSADQGDEPPTQLHEADNGRSLVSVVDCGARTTRFQWTVPLTALGTLWFNAGFVVSNQDTTPGGDGVTLVRRPLPAAGGGSVDRQVAAGCSTVLGEHRSLLPSWVLCIALVLWRRARKTRREAR